MRGPPAGRPQGSVGGKTVAGSGVASSSGPQGRGKGTRGLGLGKTNLKRHRYVSDLSPAIVPFFVSLALQ